MKLLNVTDYDSRFYEERLRDFLPDTFIDCHTHIWLDEQNHFCEDTASRSCAWPNMVAMDNGLYKTPNGFTLMSNFLSASIFPILPAKHEPARSMLFLWLILYLPTGSSIAVLKRVITVVEI